MTISASSTSTGVILQFSDSSSEVDFVGYRIERKLATGSWLVWDGLGWSENAPALLTATNFADFNVTPGLYLYRSRVEYVTESGQYAVTDWVKIGETRFGWTLGNYVVPEGSWGEILTPDDMRYTFLWGIDFKSTSGESFTDHQVRFNINSALSEIERGLNLTLKKRVIVCDADDLDGLEYDETEEPYSFRHDRWSRTGMIPLRRRPVISVERFELRSIVDQKIMDLLPWMRLSKDKGHLNWFPRVGPAGIINVNPVTALGGTYMMGGDYPHGFRVNYTAGYENSGKIPHDLREIIGKVAACKLLNIIGDGLIAGFSSSSLSMDGVSESFSSTQSAENAYFSARIKQYLKDIEDYMKVNSRKFKQFVIGSV